PVHVDEPLIHQAEEQLRLAAPAVRVAVRILLAGKEQALVLQVAQDPVSRRMFDGGLAFQPAETGHETAIVIQRSDRRQALDLAQDEVFLAATRSDVDDPRTLRLADFLPGDDTVNVARRFLRGPLL